MTRTALENKRIQSQERIEGNKLNQKKKEFKHQKLMNILSFFKPGKSGALTSMLSHNDPNWYKSYVKDLDKFTNISTYVRNGLNTYDGYLGGIYRTADDGRTENSVAGIMVFDWIPSINTATYHDGQISQEAINQILMRTKEQVLKSNSRSNVPYEAADLGLNFLATASIVNAISEYERLILLAQTYHADNAYYPEAYLTALGVSSPSSWMNNLADARKNLVLLKQRFNNALVAPKNLSIYDKYSYLGSVWIKDSETHPYSVYSCKSLYYLRLTLAGDSLEAITPIRANPEQFYLQISEMIQRIAENPDFVEMYADLRSAVRDLVQLDATFDENAKLEATYDSMALEQMSNIQTLPMVFSDEERPATINQNSLAIKQDSNGYLYQGLSVSEPGIQFSYDNSESGSNFTVCANHIGSRLSVLNLHTDNIDGNLIIDASRPKIAYKHLRNNVDDQVSIFLITDSDMAVFVKGSVYHNSYSNLTSNGYVSKTLNRYDVSTDMILTDATNVPGYVTFLSIYGKISTFKWAPLVTTFVMQLIDARDAWQSLAFGDVAHLVPLNKDTLRDINVACGLGLMYLDTDTFKM